MKEKNCCSQNETLAMASVPSQKWCDPYDWTTALEEGTIFSCLNLPIFCGIDNCTVPKTSSSTLNPAGCDQEEMLLQISKISFALNDLTLYLDTHPDCPNGLNLFYQLCNERKNLLESYAKKFNPLTQDCMNSDNENQNLFDWSEGPLPWEGGFV